MSEISFLKQPSMEELSSIAFESMLPMLEQGMDESMQALSLLSYAREGVSDALISLEALENPSDTALRLVAQTVGAAVRPIGMVVSDIVPANEATQEGMVARFKETLKRMWRAIVAAVKRVWQYLKEAFGKAFEKHRLIMKEISNCRVAMTKQHGLLPANAQVEMDSSVAVLRQAQTGGMAQLPANFPAMLKHMQDFTRARKALMESYSTKLSMLIKSMIAATGSGKFDVLNVDNLNALRAASHRALLAFSEETVAGTFVAAKPDGQNTHVVPLTGGYSVLITGVPPGKPEDPDFAARVRSLTVDVTMQDAVEFKPQTIASYSHAEITQLLNIAESLVQDISSGRMADRAKRIEALVGGYNQFVESGLNVIMQAPESIMTPEHRALCQSVFSEQAALASAFSAWGSSVFLKMETLTLRVALAITRCCQQQLKNYK